MTDPTPSANADALLPCPFCGSTPRENDVEEGSTFRWRVVKCGCGVVGPEARKDTTDHSEEAERAGRRAAIKEWNTRATQPAPEYREPTLEDAERVGISIEKSDRSLDELGGIDPDHILHALRAGGFVVREEGK